MIKKTVLAAITLACILAASFALRPLRAPAEAAQGEIPPNVAPYAVAEDEAAKARREIREETSRLLKSRDFKGLDTMAQKFRESKESFARGDWPLTFFFTELGDLPEEATEADWRGHMQMLRNWFEQDPDSITPRIALARALVSYAWKARGDGWAGEVTREGWRLMDERITEARRILIAAGNLPEKCPAWYSTRLKVAIADRTPRAEYDEIFEEAVRIWPNYHVFHNIKANYLLPRWHGEPGEWEEFAAASADRVGGEEGDLLYARMVWAMHDARVYGNPLAEAALDWPRAKRGFEELCRRYPNSISAPSEYVALAGFAPTGARKLMRSLFPLLQNRVDLSVWRTMEKFERDRKWAFAEN